MQIFGTAKKFLKPQILLCSSCEKNAKISYDNCDAVFNIQNSTNDKKYNSYTWSLAKLLPSTCGNLKIFWAVEWFIDGSWGYINPNGEFVAGYRDEFPHRQMRTVSLGSHQCPNGSLQISTEWENRCKYCQHQKLWACRPP